MKIDWTTVIATVVGMIIFSLLNKMFLAKILDKVGNLESEFEASLEE